MSSVDVRSETALLNGKIRVVEVVRFKDSRTARRGSSRPGWPVRNERCRSGQRSAALLMIFGLAPKSSSFAGPWAQSTSCSQAWLIANECDGRLVRPVALVSQIWRSTRPVSAVERFQVGDVGVGQIGDEHLVAVPVDVAEGELGAGVWEFAASDHPHPGRPAAAWAGVEDVGDEVADLGHLGVVTPVAAVGGDRWSPRLFRQVDKHRWRSRR